jgi:hypothetical protein
MNQTPGATFELSIDWGSTGATIGARILDNAGATTTARFTGFTEYPASSGVYYKTGVTAPSTSGQYTILYDDDGGTAAVGHTAVEELNVTTSAVTVDAAAGLYVTLAALKATLSITASTWNDDLTAAIAAASRAIDEECGRRFYADDDATSVRYYTPTVGSHLTIDDLAALTSVYIDTAGTGSYSTLWTSGTHFHLSPYNASEDGWPYTEIEVRGQSGAALLRFADLNEDQGLLGRVRTVAEKLLARHPEANSAFVDGQIAEWDEVNVGVATAIDAGLIVPVVLSNAHYL